MAEGSCPSCRGRFRYRLIHNGFNDSTFAYCDSCGMTAHFSGYSKVIPAEVDLKIHGPLASTLEAEIAPCVCGGRFHGDASPRCPLWRAVLDPVASAGFIEKDAPGTKGGWRWQRSWQGLYAIIIEERQVNDPWKARGAV